MSGSLGTRKQQARRLRQLLKDGPSLSAVWLTTDMTSEDVKRHYDEQVRRWLDSWIIPPVERLIPELKPKPVREDQSANGVKVIVHRMEEGTVVEADCECFGIPGRVHSNTNCPVYKKANSKQS